MCTPTCCTSLYVHILSLDPIIINLQIWREWAYAMKLLYGYSFHIIWNHLIRAPRWFYFSTTDLFNSVELINNVKLSLQFHLRFLPQLPFHSSLFLFLLRSLFTLSTHLSHFLYFIILFRHALPFQPVSQGDGSSRKMRHITDAGGLHLADVEDRTESVEAAALTDIKVELKLSLNQSMQYHSLLWNHDSNLKDIRKWRFEAMLRNIPVALLRAWRPICNAAQDATQRITLKAYSCYGGSAWYLLPQSCWHEKNEGLHKQGKEIHGAWESGEPAWFHKWIYNSVDMFGNNAQINDH